MELFNSSEFSSKNDASRDFELENVSSKKILGKGTDPAWDEPTKVSSKKMWKIGDCCTAPMPTDFNLFEDFEIAWKDYADFQAGTLEEELSAISAMDVWQQERSVAVETNTKAASKSKASDCWYTPDEIVALVQKCLQGITLDPCADDGKHIEACYHLTVADDGLSHPWFGRVFMNPPYSCPGVWIAKLQEEFNSGRVEEAIALVPVATDTKWFHPLISSNLICFWKGRIKFLDVNYQPKMPARQSHALIYWGKNQSRFREIFSPFGSFNSSEEKEAIECLNNSICAAGLAQDSPLPPQNLEDLSLSEPQKLTTTAATFLLSDTQECITTETCEESQDLQHESFAITCILQESTLLQLVPPALLFQQKDNDLEQTMSVTASPPSSQLLENCSQNSQPLKTSSVCSPAPTDQVMSEVTSDIFWKSFTPAGTMRNGLLSEVGTVPLPSLEKEFCWLPSPGALSSTGKGRPPGQTKQEGELKRLGAIAPKEVVNPEFLESSYNLPLGWTDPQEKRSALELLAEMESLEVGVQHLEMHLTPELQRSHSEESCTSIQSQSKPIPEKFLEETEQQREAVPNPKLRQRKGCLYKYIENKKLKNGSIASYPRVVGHRNPSNPTHWRWGFNWEEKIDGEWKNRSLSVKLGAIPLIQSMQREGVNLGEIIAFIKRSKSK